MSSEPSKIADYIKIPTASIDPESPVITITPATLVTTFTNGLPTPPITPTASAITPTATVSINPAPAPAPVPVPTAKACTSTAPRPILKTRTSTTPISTYITSSPPSLLTPDPMTPHASLQAPLKRHLTLMHPSTPSEIVQFCAIRLLSKDIPYGYDGEKDWKPIYEPDDSGVEVDLAAAGLSFDAPKEYRCRSRSRSRSNSGDTKGEGGGRGEGTDRRLEEMYRVARMSYGLLELKGPGVNKI